MDPGGGHKDSVMKRNYPIVFGLVRFVFSSTTKLGLLANLAYVFTRITLDRTPTVYPFDKYILKESKRHNKKVRQRLLHTVSENMGDMISRWWWGGDPDERNEVSGMSRRDIYNVQKSWTPIYANAIGNGFLMFQRLFKKDPISKTFFKSIAKASEAEMATNVYFRAHIVNIMASLNTSIQTLDKPELVALLMHKLGDAHRRLNIERRQFWIFKDVLVNILKNDLKLSDDVLVSWDRYITFIYDNILPKLDS